METYTVMPGDTLETVAKKFNINPGDLINANKLQAPYLLREGANIIIPISNANVFDYYIVNKDDTLYKIAIANGISLETLASLNGIKKEEYIYPGQTLIVPKKGIKTYITQQGDSISSVAKSFNVTQEQLLKNNLEVYLLPEQLIILRSY